MLAHRPRALSRLCGALSVCLALLRHECYELVAVHIECEPRRKRSSFREAISALEPRPRALFSRRKMLSRSRALPPSAPLAVHRHAQCLCVHYGAGATTCESLLPVCVPPAPHRPPRAPTLRAAEVTCCSYRRHDKSVLGWRAGGRGPVSSAAASAVGAARGRGGMRLLVRRRRAEPCASQCCAGAGRRTCCGSEAAWAEGARATRRGGESTGR